MNVCGDAAGTVAHGRGNTSHFRGRWGQDSANNIESVDNSKDSLHFVHSTEGVLVIVMGGCEVWY